MNEIHQLQAEQENIKADIGRVVSAVGDLTQAVTAINTNLNHVSQSI